MNDEERRQLARAAEAEHLLQHPLLVEAFSGLRERWETAWKNSRPSQTQEREEVYRLLIALDELEAQLTQHITTGKFVQESQRQSDYQNAQGVSLTYGGTG